MRCQSKRRAARRPAFTLIELLVVIALIVVLAAIAIVTIPLLQSQQKATQQGSQVAAWLGNTKAVALRDQRPTGLRLISDPTNPQFVRQLVLVQTPEDFTGGTVFPPVLLLSATNPNPPPNVIQISGANFQPFGVTDVLDQPVQAGDYFEVNGGGLLYQIVAVNDFQTLTLSRPVDFINSTPRYRILRQPRRKQGEESLNLSGNVAIDLGVPPGSLSLNVPNRLVQTGPNTTQLYYEIVFAPNGGVVGRGTVASDKIILWVRDSTRTNPTDGDPSLLSIQVRTGFNGTNRPDLTSGDLYSNARDPHASGM